MNADERKALRARIANGERDFHPDIAEDLLDALDAETARADAAEAEVEEVSRLREREAERADEARAKVERLTEVLDETRTTLLIATAALDAAEENVERLNLRLAASMPFTAAEAALDRVRAVVHDYEIEGHSIPTHEIVEAIDPSL